MHNVNSNLTPGGTLNVVKLGYCPAYWMPHHRKQHGLIFRSEEILSGFKNKRRDYNVGDVRSQLKTKIMSMEDSPVCRCVDVDIWATILHHDG